MHIFDFIQTIVSRMCNKNVKRANVTLRYNQSKLIHDIAYSILQASTEK